MAKKQMLFKTKGMNRDLSVSAFNPEFAYENRNLRLATNESNTLLSWVNERGTLSITIIGDTIQGEAIGTGIINHSLVLFTTKTTTDTAVTSVKEGASDYIYVLKYTDSHTSAMSCTCLYNGALNFSTLYPLETLVSYESEKILKVYWVDGVNLPRLINIVGEGISERDATYFDFVSELALGETITVKKLLGASGTFAPGVIQYAFTYYNSNGQETNVFYTTPLYYISNFDRGVSPEGKVENAFKIKIKGVDTRFDYLRIYSIQRTSINGTPICKRILDIAVKGISSLEVSYTDTGLNGNSIDPTELLYKGGEEITASTLEQKDGTLFLGDIKLTASHKPDVNQITGNTGWSIDNSTRTFQALRVSEEPYDYSSQLTASPCVYENNKYVAKDYTIPCGGFKRGDKYRCGVQFQHKTGKWSDPVWIDDKQVGNKPSIDPTDSTLITVPTLIGRIVTNSEGIIENLYNAGYRRARAVVVFPEMQDRYTICLGIANPTMYTDNRRETDLYALASWFFRPAKGNESVDSGTGAVFPTYEGTLPYTIRDISELSGYNPVDIRRVEIQGDFTGIEEGEEDADKFKIDKTEVLTLNSPDIEFDDRLHVMDFNETSYRKVGDVVFNNTLSSINIQTESPTIGSVSGGFVQKSFSSKNNWGIISGLFYDDWLVDDMGNSEEFSHFERYNKDHENSPVKWMVYLWNKEGSLNNDVNRPVDTGTPSAKLKEKVISNLRITTTNWNSNIENAVSKKFSYTPQLFSSDESTIVKVGDAIYQGNIDIALLPNKPDGMYFAFDDSAAKNYDYSSLWYSDITTKFNSNSWWKTFSVDPDNTNEEYGIWKRVNNEWKHIKYARLIEDVPGMSPIGTHPYTVGKYYLDLVSKREMVRIKYKSTPHLVIREPSKKKFNTGMWEAMSLPIVEIIKDPGDTIFGGRSADAFQENNWIPCGEPVSFGKDDRVIEFEYSYGDTYFQRYDCLKTYAYTKEDVNQVVEIGSFMLETHINIDGRYDRNRGQINNLNMSPQNFNLMNPVYSQVNNFFTYKIMPEDTYEDTIFPNQITWSKTKESGADVDLWTNITLASILELDGDKGKLNKLIRFNDLILAFQDTGVSQILYNENVQISSTDGVPIEIANSGKVQGKRYLSNTIGCSNKYSMATTPAGIYFMDSHDKSIYLFNGLLQNLSNQGGFASWSKINISLTGKHWNPNFNSDDFVTYYDKLNLDILFINSEIALAWSEKLLAFTSFYDYGNIPYFCNLDDTGIWIKGNQLWKHQAGEYCDFFGENKPYWMILVGNPEPLTDKIFTNIEFRACVEGEGKQKAIYGIDVFDTTFDFTFHPLNGEPTSNNYVPYFPFDYLETWNEYQHGLAYLKNRDGHDWFKHHTNDLLGTLKRKFRIWRCDIPRDNYAGTADIFDETFDYTFEGIRRKTHPMDRMRNPWLYIKLMKKAEDNWKVLPKAEIHDVVMTYYN